MLRNGYDLIRVAPHLLIGPSVAIVVTVMAFHLLAEGLQGRCAAGKQGEEVV